MVIHVKSILVSLLDINTVKKKLRQKENRDVFQKKENPYVYKFCWWIQFYDYICSLANYSK